MSEFPLAAKVTLGVLGGWLAIMAPAVVTLALRLNSFDPSGLPSFYALMLAAGWLTMLVALILLGQVSDQLVRRTGSRTLLARICVPLIAVGGLLMAWAPSPHWLLIMWILTQIPSAAIITTALAEGGDQTPAARRGLTSGLVGAASIIALLLGSSLVRMLSNSGGWTFVVPAIIGAVFATPLLFDSASTKQFQAKVETEAQIHGVNALARNIVIAWPLFIFASFLLSWATSTTNGFVVTFVQYVANALGDDIATTATTAVIIATSVAIIASLISGCLFGGSSRGPWAWSLGAVLCSASLVVMVLAQTGSLFFIAAAAFGLGFGVANGVELSIVLSLRPVHEHLGRDLGLFTAATTAPYVLVPALATVLLASDQRQGVLVLFAMAAVFAALAAAFTTQVARVMRTSRVH